MANPIDYSKLDEQLASMLNPRDPEASPLASAPRVIREAASHDFSEYRFLTTPSTVLQPAYEPVPEVRARIDDASTVYPTPNPRADPRSWILGGLTSDGGTGMDAPSGSGGTGIGTSPSGGSSSAAELSAEYIERWKTNLGIHDVIYNTLLDTLPDNIRTVGDPAIVNGWHDRSPYEFLADGNLYRIARAGVYTPGLSFMRQVEVGFELGMMPDLIELYAELGEQDSFFIAAQDQIGIFLRTRVQGIVGVATQVDSSALSSLPQSSFWEAGVDEVTSGITAGMIQEGSAAPGGAQAGEPTSGAARPQSPLPLAYPFSPYRKGSINLGLQIVYRQSWVPLGTQQGEILRTLPLGPKQSEKVSVKAIRRTKSTRQSEIVTSIETATESSAATKDSQEVIQEASEKFNWHVNATADASWGFGSASVEAGVGGETASASKDSKSTINEISEKTTSKINQSTKIVISTEVEETTELTRESVITNPNDELAVTYVYSRLQRQYEIYTYLSEVNSCIFIAEKMPMPDELDGAWIRQHDWIIAQALLDESFRPDLEVIRAHDPDEPTEDMDTEIHALMQKFSQSEVGLSQYATLPGTLPDVYATPQNAYEREVERKRARGKDWQAYLRAVRRLSTHIYDNILYYMRAIWSSEDIDARLMRYQQRPIPTWQFTPTDTDGDGNLCGTWAATGPAALLSDLINPAGPIGFAGNYAVFYLKQDGRYPDMEAAVNQLRLSYLRHWGRGQYVGSNATTFQIEVLVSPNQRDKVHYEMTWDGTQMCVVCEVIDWEGTSISQPVADVDVVVAHQLDSDTFEFDNLKVKITPNTFATGDIFEIDVFVDPILEDPELRQIRYTETPMDPAQEPGFYTIEVLAEHAEFFPEIEQALNDAATRPLATLDTETQELLRRLAAGEVSLADLDEETRSSLRNMFRSSEPIVGAPLTLLNGLTDGSITLAGLTEHDRQLLRDLFAPRTPWGRLDDATKQLIQDRLAEYLLRKRHTRQLVLDTNNVLLSLMVDNNSIIEPFKQLHRYIDVLSALNDMESKRLENSRKEARILAGRLGDPDVEKVTVVAPADRLGDFAALDGITPDGEVTAANSAG